MSRCVSVEEPSQERPGCVAGWQPLAEVPMCLHGEVIHGSTRAACWLRHDPGWGTLFSVAGAQLSVAEEEEVGPEHGWAVCV